jgi:hypothetical protein
MCHNRLFNISSTAVLAAALWVLTAAFSFGWHSSILSLQIISHNMYIHICSVNRLRRSSDSENEPMIGVVSSETPAVASVLIAAKRIDPPVNEGSRE